MKALIGITNHNQFFVLNVLRNYKEINNVKIKIQTMDFSCTVKKKAEVILVPGVATFVRNKKDLNSSNAVVFVFDNPVMCEYLSPIDLLDVKVKKKSYEYEFQEIFFNDVIMCLELDENVSVSKKCVEVIPNMLDNVVSSILTPILKYLYTNKDTDIRTEQQKIIFSWMLKEKSFSVLRKRLFKVTGKKKSKALDELEKYFDTDLGKRSLKAMTAINTARKLGKSPDYKKLAKEYNIDVFDLKYIMNTVRRVRRHVEVNQTTKEMYDARAAEKAEENNS